GHVEAEHLDAELDGEAASDVLHARRRVQLRIILRTAIARGRADGASPRSGAGLGESPPEYPWVLRCLGDWRFSIWGLGERWDDGFGRSAEVGSGEHRELR